VASDVQLLAVVDDVADARAIAVLHKALARARDVLQHRICAITGLGTEYFKDTDLH
jgi:hypothetical protein